MTLDLEPKERVAWLGREVVRRGGIVRRCRDLVWCVLVGYSNEDEVNLMMLGSEVVALATEADSSIIDA